MNFNTVPIKLNLDILKENLSFTLQKYHNGISATKVVVSKVTVDRNGLTTKCCESTTYRKNHD